MTNPSTRIESTLGGMRERELIVALLRDTAKGYRLDLADGLWDFDPEYPEHAADALETSADSIERGDHLNPPPPGEQPSMIVGWGENIPPEFRR